VFHQFKPLQSPMLATAAPVLAPRRPHIDRNCDNGLTSRFTKAQESIRLLWPIPAVGDRASIGHLVQPKLAGCKRFGPDFGTGPADLKAGVARAPGRAPLPRVVKGSRAAREDTDKMPSGSRRASKGLVGRWLPHRSYHVGSSSTNRRGNHRFQSWLCRVGMLRSVSPSNECRVAHRAG